MGSKRRSRRRSRRRSPRHRGWRPPDCKLNFQLESWLIMPLLRSSNVVDRIVPLIASKRQNVSCEAQIWCPRCCCSHKNSSWLGWFRVRRSLAKGECMQQNQIFQIHSINLSNSLMSFLDSFAAHCKKSKSYYLDSAFLELPFSNMKSSSVKIASLIASDLRQTGMWVDILNVYDFPLPSIFSKSSQYRRVEHTKCLLKGGCTVKKPPVCLMFISDNQWRMSTSQMASNFITLSVCSHCEIECNGSTFFASRHLLAFSFLPSYQSSIRACM